ncbi:MAG: hypothetical protein JWN74_678 [Acidobacteriaceae bacterium]|jgi:hypothetical protein|nr:hypothetical protein [Acidobacteriaceae bacterium]
MDSKITEEILDELIPSLEALEAKSAAVLEFLTKEGIATDEKFAPYLEQAASASNVRWLAVRVRMERLLSSVEKKSEDDKANKQEASAESKPAEPTKTSAAKAQSEEKSQPVGQEESAENGDRAKQSARKEPGTQAATGNDDDKGTRNGESDVEPKSTVSTTEKKVA